MKYIAEAIEREGRRYKGFTTYEIMDGISKLAVNDRNKKKVFIKFLFISIILTLSTHTKTPHYANYYIAKIW